MKPVEEEPAPPLELTGGLTIYRADELCVELRKWLESQQQPVLDLSAVEECDAAGIQLLYSVSAAAIKSGRQLRIAAISPALMSVIHSTGLEHEALFSTSAAIVSVPCGHDLQEETC